MLEAYFSHIIRRIPGDCLVQAEPDDAALHETGKVPAACRDKPPVSLGGLEITMFSTLKERL